MTSSENTDLKSRAENAERCDFAVRISHILAFLLIELLIAGIK